jgi:hypothetical protein
MSIPEKHHYIPEFFMRRWADGDGLVREYRRPRRDLTSKRKAPAATGWIRNLYANENKTDPLERQALEMVFMAGVDNNAADALSYLEEHRAKPADWALRDAWARYLLSLLHRSPERVAYITKKVRDYEEGTLNPDLIRRYPEIAGPNDPPTFQEWLEKQGPLTPDLRVRLIELLIGSRRVGDAINWMHWRVHRLDKLELGFISGDLPLMISNGLGHERSFVMLPIGPTKLFIASPDPNLINAFTTQYPHVLETAINDAIARQSTHILIARDDSLREFVDERFRRGRAEKKSLLLDYMTWNSPLHNVRPLASFMR